MLSLKEFLELHPDQRKVFERHLSEPIIEQHLEMDNFGLARKVWVHYPSYGVRTKDEVIAESFGQATVFRYG